VIVQPIRGYGNAYMAGFAEASGDVIITGDADRTYPLDHAVGLVRHMVDNDLDFLSTNRLLKSNSSAMKPSHAVGNAALSAVSRGLFRNGNRDSQSGMWIFRREIWQHLDVRSGGMAFSQELKNEAARAGFRCGEVPIEYRPRGGEVKLHATKDGIRNLSQLFSHRFRRPQTLAGNLEQIMTAANAHLVEESKVAAGRIPTQATAVPARTEKVGAGR